MAAYIAAWKPEDIESFKSLYQLRLEKYASLVSSNAIVLPASVLFVVVLILCFSALSTRNAPQSCDSIQALFTIITPAAVAWPRDYANLVDHCVSSRSKTVSIRTSSLIQNICDGTIEFRNIDRLGQFVSEKTVVNGWHFSLVFDALLSVEVLRWVASTHFSWKRSDLKPGPRRVLKRARGDAKPKEDTRPLEILCTLNSNSYFELDCIPFSQLDAALTLLQTTLAPGSTTTLEFTTPAQNVTFLSTEFYICAIPFLQRKYAHRSRGTPRPNRTATPLFASVHHILEHLTTGPSALTLESLTNMSAMYAEALIEAAKRLEEDGDTRTAFINQWGVEGFQEERFMIAWEAALFQSTKYLTRWVVVVRK